MSDVAVPRVAGLLLERDRPPAELHSAIAADVEVDVERVVTDGVDVAGDRRDEPHDVDRAARAAEPRAALELAVVELEPHVAGQRVGVEELVAVERDAGEEAVVDDALEHIDVLRVAVQQEHAVVPQGQRDRGAGLVVGLEVVELVGPGVALAGAVLADAAGEVELAADDVLPDAVDRGDVVLRRR